MNYKLLLALLPLAAGAQTRTEVNLDRWLFSRDSLSWRAVTVPHDWAIDGPFDKKIDLQFVAIEQNGETEKTEKSGRSGSLPWIGRGWYTTTVHIDSVPGQATLLFDGAMSHPVVRVNGHEAGRWAYGYNAFRIDATPYLRPGRNTIEVSLENAEESSRWYPGAGLYRPVTLIMTGAVRLDPWHSWARTRQLTARRAVLDLQAGVELGGLPSDFVDAKASNLPQISQNSQIHASQSNPSDFANAMERQASAKSEGLSASAKSAKSAGNILTVEWSLADPNGRVVATTSASQSSQPSHNSQSSHSSQSSLDALRATLTIPNPQPWSPESPSLYTLTTRLMRGSQVIDQTTRRIGLRTVAVSAKHGFQLNGKTRKLQGVCLHHDLGPIGAAVSRAAIERQIRLLKDMGADAIRTAHNMPSQLQMDVCDSMGMMVMAESFDMWQYPKCKNGYARDFDQWVERDLENEARHLRNHPSIVMWSIGNEIPEQGMEGGTATARRLQAVFHRLDPTRPVTQGMDRAEDALRTGFAQAMDVPGFNYRVHKYDRSISQLPQGFLLGSETASTVSSRGVYHFPVTVGADQKHADLQCSGYDTEYCSWSNLPDDDWQMQQDRRWTIGEFVWTGFDYLGEPTPYDEEWPSRSSYFGIFDLAGLPKDRYWLYRSHWNHADATLHVLPHWTWPGREGQVTPVYVYTSYPEAELFVNGVSQGRRRKDPKSRLDRYRLRWNDVVYQPGSVRVVAYDDHGREAATETVRTAGAAHHLELRADRRTIAATGRDLCFVTATMVDRDGIPVPMASQQVTLTVTGAGRYRAACNGDATSLVSFSSERMPLFSGQLVAVVEGTTHGTATLHAQVDGLPEATIDINVE